MKATILDEAKRLEIDERIELVEAIWDSVANDAGVDEVPVPSWHREELDRRLADLEAKPETGSSWDEVRKRLENRR